jgi:site-specific DNA-methyltransferase (adenine-specific)
MKRLNHGKQKKSVWTITAPPKREKIFGKHPTQKPIALIELCLKASTNEGAIVLDPFMGTGTSGVACIRLNREFVGVELDESHIRIAVKRMKEAATFNPDLLQPTE